MNRILQAAFCALGLGAAAATRLPAAPLSWPGGLTAAGALLLASAVFSARARPALAGVAAASVALVGLPRSAGAWLGAFPPFAVTALVALALFAAFVPSDQRPAHMGGRTSWLGKAARVSACLMLLALPFALPPVAIGLLPDRLASSHELRGGAGSLVTGLLILALLTALAAVRALVSKPAAPSTPGGSP